MSSPTPSPTTPPAADKAFTGPEALMSRAYELSRAGASSDAVEQMMAAAGPQRKDLEEARDRVAAQVRARVDDFAATAALQLLNRALSKAPIHDPLDWRVRWTQRFRRP